MAYQLGVHSLEELKGVHPLLNAVVHEAITLSEVDFSVHDGIRTIPEQKQYVASGVSTTMNSKHLPQEDGYGHAVDLVPYINRKLRWEWEPIYRIAWAVRRAAVKQGVKVRWGGVWDRLLNDLPDTLHGIRIAVEDYVARRKAQGKRAFIDGPHFELA